MPIQDVKRAVVQPLFRAENLEEEVRRFQAAYSQLAQEVVSVHNRVQQFGIVVGAGLVTVAVTMAHPTYTVFYCVGVDFSFNNGGYWTTAKTINGFTLNWATASVGVQSARLTVVE